MTEGFEPRPESKQGQIQPNAGQPSQITGMLPEQVLITKVKNGLIIQTPTGIYVSDKLNLAYLIVQNALGLQ